MNNHYQQILFQLQFIIFKYIISLFILLQYNNKKLKIKKKIKIQNVWDTSKADDIAAAFGYPGLIHIYRKSDYMIYLSYFYMSLIIIVLFFFMFLYTYILIAKQKQINYLLINIQQIIINLIIYILYVPFLDIFIIIINCQSTKGQMKLAIYPNEVCWSGMHIFNGACGIVGISLLEIFAYLFSYLYFNGISNNKKTNSVQNSRHVLTDHYNLCILVFSYNFLSSKEFNGVLIAIYFIGSNLVFYMIYTRMPFNNQIVQRYQSLFTTVYVWTSIMLSLTYLTEKKVFHGLLYAWAIGLPLIMFIIFWIPIKQNQETFTMNVNINNFTSPQQVIQHANYVQKLIQNDISKTQTSHLLNGYIQFHNKTCLSVNCPMNKIKYKQQNQNQQEIQNKDQKKLNQKIIKQDKRYIFCYEMLSKLYEAAIATYPQDVSLRIAYSVFLMKVLKSKQNAINEITEAENLKISYDDFFTIYQIKRTLETEINQAFLDGNIEYSEQRNLEGQIQHLRIAMEQTVSLLIEFWSQFLDERPDLIKLYDIGSKLFPLKQMVDLIWKKLSRNQGEQLPKLFRIYSKYLIEIFNDKQQGKELLDKASQFEKSQINRRDFHFNYSIEQNLDGNQDAMIFMTLDEDRIGQIISTNLSCVSLFGYAKTELLNKNVSFLMPFVYAKYHDQILKRYIETNEGTMINKDKIVYGKNKNGYVFPITINIKPIFQALKYGMEFIAIFKKEKIVKNYAVAIATPEYLIKDISSNSLNILGIDLKTISLQSVYLNNLINDIQQYKQCYLNKNGKQIEYTFPKINEDLVLFNKGNYIVKLNVWLIELQFKIKEKDKAGFIFRVELQQPKNINLMNSSINKSRVKQQKKNSINSQELDSRQNYKLNDFLFKAKIDKNYFIFQGEYKAGLINENPNNQNSISIRYENKDSSLGLSNSNEIIVSQLANQKEQIQNENILQNKKKIDYGQGFKTLRLIKSVLRDIDKEQSNIELSESELEQENKQEKQNKLNHKQNQNIDLNQFCESDLNSAKELNQELSAQSESATVSSLKYFSIFVIICMILIATLDFSLMQLQISTQNNLLKSIILVSNRMSEVNEVISLTRELLFLAKKIRQPPQYSENSLSPSFESDEKVLRNKIQTCVVEIEFLTIKIQEIYQDSNDIVKIYFEKGSFQEFQLSYSTQQFISKTHNIIKLQLSEIKESQSDVFFILFNGLNDYFLQLKNQYFQIVSNSQKNFEEIISQSQTFLFISISVMLIFSLIVTVLLGKTMFAKLLILSVFLEIPENTAKYLYLKCDNFLAQLGSEEEDQVHSEIELNVDEKNNNNDKANFLVKRKKKFKNTDNGNIRFLLKMLIVAVFIEAYFIFNYILGNNNIQIIKDLQQEYNFTNFVEPYYSFTQNALKQHIFDSTWTILNSNSLTIVNNLIDNLYEFDSNLHQEHAKNSDQHNNSANYLDFFKSVMFDDACIVIVQQKGASQTECEQFSQGLVRQLITTVFYLGGWVLNNILYSIAQNNNFCTFHFRTALIINILAWITQFIGHGVFEKRSPALLDNILYTLSAPNFVTIEYNKVGSGTYGTVIACIDKENNNQLVSIKKIEKAFEHNIYTRRTIREIKLQRLLKHENVLGITQLILPLTRQDFNDIYLVQPLMQSDFREVLNSNQELNEEHLQYFMYQIFRGLKYIHSGRIVHRDLKPKNILSNYEGDLKICDFGFARYLENKLRANDLSEYVTARWYRAPEILLSQKNYDYKVDIWSAGIIMAEIIKRRPFVQGISSHDQIIGLLQVLGTPEIQNIKNIGYRSIFQSLPKFEKINLNKIFPQASELALDLLKQLLEFDPDLRFSAQQALEHPFFQYYIVLKMNNKEMKQILQNLNMNNMNQMRNNQKVFYFYQTFYNFFCYQIFYMKKFQYIILKILNNNILKNQKKDKVFIIILYKKVKLGIRLYLFFFNKKINYLFFKVKYYLRKQYIERQ
ncbi:PAS domain S-box family protein [Ichthyophthirius multifiliis]|uniref:PAS domain S-box family protein n=1 Tax=Ichthyophthirius multifiliis TaxID=5932 RepID=G0QYR4_ICHMU|nr:PAS domain S-box family protein [Ichthyophthirius multifiliis]EGR29625.1 PAS domain S-box family protein [Ichthyophthirius multifiliis]|eukprot:XP_004030861.1 PAS domain S-box family protein [Ichthyophthirius multifiliis]